MANPDPRITPYLLYEDVDAALAWLEKAFGLTPFGDSFKGPDGKTNHAAMKLLDGAVMMGCPGAGYQNPRKLGAVTQQLYIRITGVDRHFERARRAGADIVEAPTDTFYGARRYAAADPEGHVWYFAEHKQASKQDPKKKARTRRKKKKNKKKGKRKR
jgi:uncharacterized glyoxalase superfamily protein PhnB